MTPSDSVNYCSNTIRSYVKVLGDIYQGFAVFLSRPNTCNIFFCQARLRVIRSLSHSSFNTCVFHVANVVALKEVRWTDAGHIVAFMTDENACRNYSKVNDPRYDVRGFSFTFPCHVPIGIMAVYGTSSLSPKPASTKVRHVVGDWTILVDPAPEAVDIRIVFPKTCKTAEVIAALRLSQERMKSFFACPALIGFVKISLRHVGLLGSSMGLGLHERFNVLAAQLV